MVLRVALEKLGNFCFCSVGTLLLTDTVGENGSDLVEKQARVFRPICEVYVLALINPSVYYRLFRALHLQDFRLSNQHI